MIRKVSSLGVLFWSAASLAAHPLATDDVGTQDPGRIEWEASAFTLPGGPALGPTAMGAGLAAHVGVTPRLAVGVGAMHAGLLSGEPWSSSFDLAADMKWRLIEFGAEGDSGGLALRFDYFAPTGFDARTHGHGLGGRAVMTLAAGRLEYHLNAGLDRTGLGTSEVAWTTTVSNAVGFEARRGLRVLAEAGVQLGQGEMGFTALGAVQWQPREGLVFSAGAGPAWSALSSAAWTTALGVTFTAP